LKLRLTRRNLLVGAAAGGGLLVAYAISNRRPSGDGQAGPGDTAFGSWIRIARDGMITVALPQLEMGQGVSTLLPQIVAMEMGADWRQVAVEPAPLGPIFANAPLAAHWSALWLPLAPGLADEPDDYLARRFAEVEPLTATAAGLSLAAYEQPCREAAAAARAMLAMAAADRWDVDWEECEAANGFVRHGNKRLRFGDLADEAASYDPPDPPILRAEAPADTSSLGQIDFPRLDLPSKVDGSHLFAGDVRLPDMVHASVRLGPLGETELTDLDTDALKGVAGLVGLVRGKRWVAAVASTWWSAEKALRLMEPVFTTRGSVNTEQIEHALQTALAKDDGHRIFEAGEGDDELGKPTLSARYDITPAFHATLETASATARLSGGKLELWIASQAPDQARRAAAEAVSLPVEDVILYPMSAGGSFERRLEHDHAIQAAVIAREIGKPVQLMWSRWTEHMGDRPRTPAAAVLSARLQEDGAIASWRNRIACPATAREFGHRLFENVTPRAAMEKAEGKADPMAIAGAMPPYDIPYVAVDHHPASIALPTGPMRGAAHGYTAFLTESFIDELAAMQRREPLSYRIQMLGSDTRLAACLMRAARLAKWNGGLDQSGQGVACHRIEIAGRTGRIAAIATATRAEMGVRVSSIAVAVDIGRIVNRDIARQQVEGSLMFGIDLALGCNGDYAKGLPVQARFSQLGLPLLADAPEILVEFVESKAEPFDPGELGVAVAAPAIANALYSATGLRFRRLPLLSGGL
jgi:isoquinoline 1-oxidoreductase beta subunit